MIFSQNFEGRLQSWAFFRLELETHRNPIQACIDFWNQAPISARTCDPYNKENWPDAWELIAQNKYCEFSKILAIYYTLSLTERFEKSKFYIQVVENKTEHKIHYLLINGNEAIGYDFKKPVSINEISNLIVQENYDMSLKEE
jgi:hypothetical protein